MDLLGGFSSVGGPFGSLELGAHPKAGLGVYVTGRVDRAGWMAGSGVRLDF